MVFPVGLRVMQQSLLQQDSAEHSLNEKLLMDKVHQAYNVAPRIFLPALSLSFLLAAGVWNQTSHAWLIAWLCMVASCYLIRAVDWRHYHSLAEQHRDARIWSFHMHLAAAVTGLMWGLAAFLPSSTQVSFFIGFVLTGVSAGAVPGLSSLPRAAMAFVVCCITPFALHSFIDDGLNHILMGLMSLLFIAVMIITIITTHARVDLGIRQRLQLIQRDAELTHNEKLRNTVNESLRRAQAQLRSFINYAPAAVAMFDCKLQYLAYSARWTTDYGLLKNENTDQFLKGRNFFEVMPDAAEMMRESFAASLAGEVQTNDQYPFIRNDGTVRWFRWEMRPWYEDSGAMGGVVMYSEDITDAKRTNDALYARERLLDKLGVQVPGVMFQGRWRKDAGFRLTYVSANAYSVCGLTSEQLCQQPSLYLKLFAAYERVHLRNAAQLAAARAGNIHLQLRIRTKDKSIRWLQINAVAERLADASVLWYGYVEDVSLRHKMALDLAKYGALGEERSSAA